MVQITKIPNFGDAGIIVDGVDFSQMTNEEWMHWGKVHLEKLVIIFKNTTPCTIDRYSELSRLWGWPYANNIFSLLKKYGLTMKSIIDSGNTVSEALKKVADDDDKRFLMYGDDVLERPNMQRVSGQKNDQGRYKGIFPIGELFWHANESGQLVRNPTVMLMSVDGIDGSSTGFATSHLWYESQSNAFRSELDEMICEHDFVQGRISPGCLEETDDAVRRNMSSGYELMPLVENSPGGIRGLHISNTVIGIKGMSKDQSDQFLDRIKAEMLAPEKVYDYWWQKSGEIAIFDNSITQHRRLGGDLTKRLMLRQPSSLRNVLDHTWCPYDHSEYRQRYWNKLTEMASVFGGGVPKPMKKVAPNL